MQTSHKTYRISKNNLNKLLNGYDITLSQAKILGYNHINELRYGWKNKLYLLNYGEMLLFRKLSGVIGVKNQKIIINEHKIKALIS